MFCICLFPKNKESSWACALLPHVFTKAVWGTTSHRDENLPCVASHFHPWKRKHAKLMAPRLLPEGRPLFTPWPAELFPQLPGIYRVPEEAPAFHSTLVWLPPGPQVL